MDCLLETSPRGHLGIVKCGVDECSLTRHTYTGEGWTQSEDDDRKCVRPVEDNSTSPLYGGEIMEMEPSHKAAAFWGSAKNQVYSVQDRLALALKALEFYGGEYEKAEALAEEMAQKLRTENVPTPVLRVQDLLPDFHAVYMNSLPIRHIGSFVREEGWTFYPSDSSIIDGYSKDVMFELVNLLERYCW